MTKSNDTLPLEADVTKIVIGGFFDAYNRLGRGFLESVYEGAMEVILKEAGLQVKRQYPIDVWFRGSRIGHFSRRPFDKRTSYRRNQAGKANPFPT